MRLISRSSILSLSIGFALALVPAYATTITTYGDPSSWANATTPGDQTVTFEGLTAPGTVTNYFGATGVTSDGVEFIGYTYAGVSDIQVIDTSISPWYDDGTSDALIQSMDRPNSSSPLPYINIVLPANVTALGMDLWTASPAALSYTITVAGNQYTVPTVSQNTETFWGITSDTPISSLQLTLAGSAYNGGSDAFVDNFSFGASDLTAAPEAGTYLLIGSGLIGLVILRKRLTPDKPR